MLRRFKEKGIKLRTEKCKLLEKSVTYFGHDLDKRGVRPSDEILCAIKEAPTPKNRQEFRSFLGLLNFTTNFVPNMSTQLKALYDVLSDKAK